MKRVFTKYLRPYYARMAFGFVIKFIGTVMDLFLPWILAHMIDIVIPTGEKGRIYLWGVVMILCSLLAVTFSVIANRMASKVSSDATEALRHDLFTKIMYLSGKTVDEFSKPSLISRLTTDTYNIHQMIGRAQRLGVRAPILLIGGVTVTLFLDPVLACILLAIMPLLAVIIVLVSRKSIPMYTALQESIDRFVRLVREDISGIRVIKALSKADSERARFDKINQEVVRREKKAGMTTAVINPSMNLLLNMGLVMVILAGAYRVHQGTSEVGKILAFMTYFTIILNAVLSISKMFVIISKAIASADRIDLVLEAEDETQLLDLDREIQKDSFIEFDHVTFSYNKVEPDLYDITFQVKKGETLGIIGETGSGKTTIANLMMRFYDVDEGAVYVAGENVKSMNPGKLRQLFGVALQNDTIFENTILENVRLGRDLSKDQIKDALKSARAAEFVEEKGNKVQEKLDIKGANLSGGQKQRVLIARALAAHPSVLILDDSSSALDYKTDAALRSEIKEHYRDTTTVIIAQRISSIMQADHIIVLEGGRMIGCGNHEELMQTCEVYREISQSQMGVG